MNTFALYVGYFVILFGINYTIGSLFTFVLMCINRIVHKYNHLPLEQVVWWRAIFIPLLFPVACWKSSNELKKVMNEYSALGTNPRVNTCFWLFIHGIPFIVGLVEIPFVIFLPRFHDFICLNKAYKIRQIRVIQDRKIRKLYKEYYKLYGRLNGLIATLTSINPKGDEFESFYTKRNNMTREYTKIAETEVSDFGKKIEKCDQLVNQRVKDLLSKEQNLSHDFVDVELHANFNELEIISEALRKKTREAINETRECLGEPRLS